MEESVSENACDESSRPRFAHPDPRAASVRISRSTLRAVDVNYSAIQNLCMCVCVCGYFFFQLDFCFQWTYGRWGASWERWSKAASSSRALIVSFTALAAGGASHRPQTSVWHAGLDKDMSLLICDPKHLLNHLNGVHLCSQHCVLD